MSLTALLALGACNDLENIYLYDARILETDFANGAQLTVNVALNGDEPEKLTCRLKSAMTPVWRLLQPGGQIKLARSSQWKYDTETFCGLLNQSDAKEIVSQHL